MKQRYRLFRRAGACYVHNNITGDQESLRTKDRKEAFRFWHAKNEAHQQPHVNLQIARAYLAAADPEILKRTGRTVMEAAARTKHGETLRRWSIATRDKAFDLIRKLPLLETRPEHLFTVLAKGTVSTNVYLRRLQNFALDMSWLPWPVIPKRQWSKVEFRSKRAITAEEHQRILQREPNAERKAFYELCWQLAC